MAMDGACALKESYPGIFSTKSDALPDIEVAAARIHVCEVPGGALYLTTSF